ncbi:hypothetical protein RDABS01_022191 [Bienertia sinuspersici]
MVSPSELCHWLLLADIFGSIVLMRWLATLRHLQIPENFEPCFLTLPPPSGDSSLRTTAPSAPGGGGNLNQANILDDLREKWLEVEAGELDERDESALLFDKRLEMLMHIAEQEQENSDYINESRE